MSEEPQIDRQRLLEAASWLTTHMQDPEIQVAVAGAVRRHQLQDISAWAKAHPAEVVEFYEALADVAAQDEIFETKVLAAGRDAAPVVDDFQIDWSDLAR